MLWFLHVDGHATTNDEGEGVLLLIQLTRPALVARRYVHGPFRSIVRSQKLRWPPMPVCTPAEEVVRTKCSGLKEPSLPIRSEWPQTLLNLRRTLHETSRTSHERKTLRTIPKQ